MAALSVAAPLVALILAGCGSHGSYGWLRPKAPPAGWPVMRIPTGAAIAYPPTWRRVRGDRGTASAALIAADGGFDGYLNLTPRQGGETPATWASFRVDHNREEGDRQVVEQGHASGLRFAGGGHGACVSDRYVTSVGSRYMEFACLVVGASGSATVVVAAAPPDDWSKVSPTLERAISTLTT